MGKRIVPVECTMFSIRFYQRRPLSSSAANRGGIDKPSGPGLLNITTGFPWPLTVCSLAIQVR